MRLAVNFQRVDPSKGGAETYVADLCRALVSAGHRVDLYSESWRADALPSGVRPIRVETSGPARWARIWSFAARSEAMLRAESYDCTIGFINTWHQDILIPQGGVHAGSLQANSRRFPAGWRRWAYLAAKRVNPKHWLYRGIEARQYDPARRTRVVAVSQMVRGHLERFHGVPRERIRVIPNAIDADRLAVADPIAARRAFRAEHGLAESDLAALFVGHNFRLKGLPALLKALALRRHRDAAARPIHLLVCGGGKIAPARREVERLGLAETVHLIGFVADVRAAYHAADFCVLPTYYDPCSLVVFEALACGLPVITTACNGAGELMTPGREGFVVESPDVTPELANVLDRLTDDHARREMSTCASALGRAQSFENHVGALLELIAELAEEKRRFHRKELQGIASRV